MGLPPASVLWFLLHHLQFCFPSQELWVIFSFTLRVSVHPAPMCVCVCGGSDLPRGWRVPCRYVPVMKRTIYLLTTPVMKANWHTGPSVNLKAQRCFLSTRKCFGESEQLCLQTLQVPVPDLGTLAGRGCAASDFAVGQCFPLRVPRN